MRPVAVLTIALAANTLAGCGIPATQPVPPTPMLPPMVWGVYLDNDVGAIQFAAWAFASPANTRGNPTEAARGIIALEYLSGELVSSPRWVGIGAGAKFRMNEARDEVRRVVGIPTDAPPQLVVDALLAFVQDMQVGHLPGATEVLNGPLFRKGPAGTLETLANLPYVPQANFATDRVAQEAMARGGP